MRSLEHTAERLCTLSRRAATHLDASLDWPLRLEPGQWFMSPELISLHGSEAFERLDLAEQQRLSFHEAVNFFSLNIHGEKALVEGLARRLYQPGHEAVAPYLHHFLDEENKHMAYFAGFCMRYAGKVYPDRKLAFPRDYAPGEEDFLFFAKALIFEEIVDVLNKRMARDARLAPVVREINRLHHADEARHLAFGRAVVAELFGRFAPHWNPATLQGVRTYLQAYLGATFREYHNPDVYRDAGLTRPLQLLETTYQAPAARARRRDVGAGCIRFLRKAGILHAPFAP